MKKKILLSFACLTMALHSCSKDDGIEAVPNSDDAINALENTKLDATKVSNELKIEGAVKNAGTPPTPNGKVAFELDFETQSAFQNAGFELILETPDNYAGAYIQIKSEDGTLADSYYDIEKGSGQKIAGKRVLKNITKQIAQKKKVDFEYLNIGFGAGVPPGKFCYIICLYDTEQNISLPQEVCVTVEAWGGNSALVGTWKNTKEEDTVEGVVTTTKVGEQECSDGSFTCSVDQKNIFVKDAYCYTTNSFIVQFNADGTFESQDIYSFKNLKYSESRAECKAVYSEETNAKDIGRGNWAYDVSTKELTIVSFYYNDNGDEEDLEQGDAYSLKMKLSGNELIFVDDDIYTNKGMTIKDVYKQFFIKS